MTYHDCHMRITRKHLLFVPSDSPHQDFRFDTPYLTAASLWFLTQSMTPWLSHDYDQEEFLFVSRDFPHWDFQFNTPHALAHNTLNVKHVYDSPGLYHNYNQEEFFCPTWIPTPRSSQWFLNHCMVDRDYVIITTRMYFLFAQRYFPNRNI